MDRTASIVGEAHRCAEGQVEWFTDPECIVLDQGVPRTQPYQHTMTYALHDFIRTKVPTEHIAESVAHQIPFSVVGIHAPHLPTWLKSRGYAVSDKEEWTARKPGKKYNYIRPALFAAVAPGSLQREYYFCVFPGRDYVQHYGWMLRQAFDIFKEGSARELLKIYLFPGYTRLWPEWTGLKGIVDEIWIQLNQIKDLKRSVCVVGMVQNISDMLADRFPLFRRAYARESDLFGYEILVHHNTAIVLFGVRFSFWGDLSGVLCGSLYAAVDEIVYVGKLGSTTSPDDPYQAISVPHSFTLSPHPFHPDDALQHLAVDGLRPLNSLIAPLAREISKAVGARFLTGTHVSVPTIVGETLEQSQRLTEAGVTSIDNEITYMAEVAARNKKSFGCMHFVTDYVRNPDTAHRRTDADLAKMVVDPQDLAARRITVLRQIATVVCCYLCGIRTGPELLHSLEQDSEKEQWLLIDMREARGIDLNLLTRVIQRQAGVRFIRKQLLYTQDVVKNVGPFNIWARRNGYDLRDIPNTSSVPLCVVGSRSLVPVAETYVQLSDNDTELTATRLLRFVAPKIGLGRRRHSENLRVAVFGTGAIAADFCINAPLVGCTVTYVVSKDLQRAEHFIRRTNVSAHGTTDLVEAAEGSDFAYVANANHLHAATVGHLLELNKPVLCEKPLCTSREEAARLFTLAQKQHRLLMEALPPMYLPFGTHLQSALEEIGAIQDVRIVMWLSGEKAAASPILKRAPGGGAFEALGSYTLYLASLIVDLTAVHEVEVESEPWAESCGEVDGHTVVTFSVGKTRVELSHSLVATEPRQARILGERGTITIDEPHTPRRIRLLLNDDDGVETVARDHTFLMPGDGAPALRRSVLAVELLHFVRQWQEGDTNVPSKESGATGGVVNTKRLCPTGSLSHHRLVSLSIQGVMDLVRVRLRREAELPTDDYAV